MAFQTGFTVSLELTKRIPALVTSSATQTVLDRLRNFRNSGSDILVEEDLALTFGQVKICRDLESRFRLILRDKLPENPPLGPGGVITAEPLYRGSELGLDCQGSETLRRALGKDGDSYLSAVIQLSFLSWMHDREYLATALDEALSKRIQSGIEGAVNPGFSSR